MSEQEFEIWRSCRRFALPTPKDALFASEAVSRGGLPIVELTTTVPNASKLLGELLRKHPHMIVGAGSVHLSYTDITRAQRFPGTRKKTAGRVYGDAIHLVTV